jgi:hypothetical protein
MGNSQLEMVFDLSTKSNELHYVQGVCIYIYIYICVCMCVCVREREREIISSYMDENSPLEIIWSLIYLQEALSFTMYKVFIDRRKEGREEEEEEEEAIQLNSPNPTPRVFGFVFCMNVFDSFH